MMSSDVVPVDGRPESGLAGTQLFLGLRQGRKNQPMVEAEADAIESLALAPPLEDDRVPIFQKASTLAVAELHRLFAGKRKLHQRACFGRLRPGDRATAQQVARLQIAAACSVV